MAIKLSIANQKGGVGKTTTAIELASILKTRGYSVLAIDLDQQANLTTYIGANPNEDGMFEILSGTADIKSVIQHTEEFDVISASDKLSKADKVFSDARDVLLLKKVLKTINDDYDFIIIDNNPSRNVLLNMNYVATDYIIIPMEAEQGSIQGLKAIYKDLEDYKADDFSDADILGIILTKYEKTGMHSYIEEQIQEQLEEFNLKNVFVKTVRKSIVANESKSEGSSMNIGKHSSKPSQDYRDIVDTIIDIVV